MIMLDLFSGLGGASEAFVQHPDWTVVRIDNEPLVESVPHTILMDMEDFNPLVLPAEIVDLVWASPPCTEFSTARCPPIEKPSLRLVQRAIEIIDAVNPRCWIIENVRGSIKHLQPILGAPRLILGPYVFWGNFPLFWVDMDGYSKMEDDAWSSDPLRPQKRAYIPLEVSVSLLEALKNQATLDRWMPKPRALGL
jgi:hypothetical protein